MMEIKPVGVENAADAQLPNQPFRLWGRMIPALCDGQWSYRTEALAAPSELCFPDVPYDVGDESAAFLGAYEDGRCIGLAVLREGMFRYLLLEDLKVDRAYRRQGVGGMLIAACMREAAARKLQGVYAIAQDDNLSACLFYLKQGFAIGGFDNRAYRGTKQDGKADLCFYRDCAD